MTTRLAERDERTTMTMTILYESRAARDEAIEAGMTTGLDASFERVDALLAELRVTERR